MIKEQQRTIPKHHEKILIAVEHRKQNELKNFNTQIITSLLQNLREREKNTNFT